jgi:type IV secretory pathway VirB9-like protein
MNAAHILLAAGVLAGDPAMVARHVVYHENDVIRINVQVHYVTAVHVLPKSEKIVEAHCGFQTGGDQEFFGCKWLNNVLYIAPGDYTDFGIGGGLKTNIEIVTVSGNTIDLMAYEVSKTSGAHADLKVFVSEGDQEQLDAAKAKPKFLLADEVEQREEADKAKQADLQKQLEETRRQLALAATKEASAIRHDYELVERKGKDFHAAVYDDGKFTTVEVKTQELPTLWEILDGKPAKVDAPFRDGRFVVEHVMDECELRIGKSEAKFRRMQRG